jgi:hypothetical protein
MKEKTDNKKITYFELQLADKIIERDCLNEEIIRLENRIWYLKNPQSKETFDEWCNKYNQQSK